VPLNLGRRAFDPQIFGRKTKAGAVVKGDIEQFSASFRRRSTGQRVVPPALTKAASSGRRGLGRQLVVAQTPRLVDQHDRDAVADRIGEPRLLADQLLGAISYSCYFRTNRLFIKSRDNADGLV
jgi:hypothetical protein